MRIIECDICGRGIKYLSDAIQVEINDGEHPHNGSTMTKTIDCCIECFKNITNDRPIRVEMELDVAKRKER